MLAGSQPGAASSSTERAVEEVAVAEEEQEEEYIISEEVLKQLKMAKEWRDEMEDDMKAGHKRKRRLSS